MSLEELKKKCFEMISERGKEPVVVEKSSFESICCDNKGFFIPDWEKFSLENNLIAKINSYDKSKVGVFINDRLHVY